MDVRCAWCGRFMYRIADGDDAVSHGICQECYEIIIGELERTDDRENKTEDQPT